MEWMVKLCNLQLFAKWLTPYTLLSQKFIPSEFGSDPSKTRISGLDHNFYSNKLAIRRLLEDEGIPYTCICCNFYMSYLLPSLVQPGLKTPPRDKVTIFGNGDVKGHFCVCCISFFFIFCWDNMILHCAFDLVLWICGFSLLSTSFKTGKMKTKIRTSE